MIQKVFTEFVALLCEHGVRFMIVGAHAVGAHATPRSTQDLDIWFEPSPRNASLLISAVREFFGGYDGGLKVDDLAYGKKIVSFGQEPTCVDLIGSIDGVPDFSGAYDRAMITSFGPVRDVPYISFDDLIAAKQAVVGRERRRGKSDAADLYNLLKIAERKAKKKRG